MKVSGIMLKRVSFVFTLFILAVACSKPIPKELDKNLYPEDSDIKITYFSTACLLIEFDEYSILTDPFVSNNGWQDMLFMGMDKSYAHEHEEKFSEMSKVSLVVAGHSHYDHIADIPYFSNKISPDALILGNQSMLHIMAAQPVKQKMLALDHLSGNYEKRGEWVYLPDSSIRVMAFKSQHLPHVGKIHFGSGGVDKPLEKLPKFFNNWREGQNHTFMIDLLRGDSIVKRIYMQSSPHPTPVGLPPKEVLDEKKVDLAILGTVKFNTLEDYLINYIDFLQPEEVFLCHWDNFFTPGKNRNNYLSMSKLPEQIKILEEKFPFIPIWLSVPVL